MAGRDIEIPFGPDKTGGLGLQSLAAEEEAAQDPFAEPPLPQDAPAAWSNAAPQEASAQPAAGVQPVVVSAAQVQPAAQPVAQVQPAAQVQPTAQAQPVAQAQPTARPHRAQAQPASDQDAPDYRAGGLSDEEAAANGMDAMQMSILAFKDSIGQSRELKQREKERDELAEALAADHEELADRENILANYSTLVAEQDAIVAQSTQQREARKAELARATEQADIAQQQLDSLRDQYALQMQPIETELGRVRAAADQAKNDERSRKAELSAAESELRRADDNDANTMAVSRHQQVQAAYDEARARSEQAKRQLADVQRAYDDAKQQAAQAAEPLELTLEDLNRQSEELKRSISRLGEEISVARKRRQYCDTVYQYPDETAKMRREVEAAEATARKMDADNDALREQLAQSKKMARKAKVALGIVIAIIVVFIVTLIIVSNR